MRGAEVPLEDPLSRRSKTRPRSCVSLLVAVCGAEFQGSFPHNRPVLAPAGSRFNVGRAVRGARAYLAVAGGFAVEPDAVILSEISRTPDRRTSRPSGLAVSPRTILMEPLP